MNTMPQMPGHLAPVAMQQQPQPQIHAKPVEQMPLPGNTGIVPQHPINGPTTHQHAGGPMMKPVPTPGAAPAAVPGSAATNSLTNFANSAGMQFAQQQGANVLNNLYAAHGQVQSGAAAKALQTFGQNTALQQYFPMYTNLLQGQQAMGLGAAQGIAGVGSAYGNAVGGAGQNYANSVGNLNSSLGNAIGQGALNIGNANANNAAIRGYGNAGIGSAIGSAVGGIGSAWAGTQSSYGAGGGGFNAATNPIYGASLY